MVALSGIVIIWLALAIKLRYLENHASQLKSYYKSLSGNHSHSFRISHEKSPKAHPGGEITTTSYPAFKENLVISETIHPR